MDNKKAISVNPWFYALPLIGGLSFPVFRYAGRHFYESNPAKRTRALKIITVGAFAALMTKVLVGYMYARFPRPPLLPQSRIEVPPKIILCIIYNLL